MNQIEVAAAGAAGFTVLDVFGINRDLYKIEKLFGAQLRWDPYHWEAFGYEIANTVLLERLCPQCARV